MKVPISGEECHEPFRAALRLRWLPLPSQHRHSGAGILEGDILGPGQKRPPSLRKLRERAAQPLGRYAASPQPPWLPALWAEQAPSPLLPAPGHSLPPEALTPEKWPLRVVRSPGTNWKVRLTTLTGLLPSSAGRGWAPPTEERLLEAKGMGPQVQVKIQSKANCAFRLGGEGEPSQRREAPRPG